MRNAAVYLAVHDQRVDGAPDIVDRGVAHDLYHPGIGVHLDLADVTTIGETGEVHGLVAFGSERSAQFVRQVVAAPRPGRDLEQSDRPVGAFDAEPAVDKFEIGRGGFQDVACDLRTLGDDVAR